jgi:Cu(I)/Ag(I) efflux system periplasmic protein CusF
VRVQFILLTAAALSLALAACSPPEPAADAPPAAEQATPSGPVRSRGVVFAVTREYNAITIQHEAIPEYEMAPMVMEFTVDDPSQLEGIEAGDSVTFELRSGLDIATIQEVDAN